MIWMIAKWDMIALMQNVLKVSVGHIVQDIVVPVLALIIISYLSN